MHPGHFYRDDGVVRIGHPLLKHPVAVPIGQIAAVVEPVGSESDPLLARDVRILTFAGGGWKTNLVLVFRSPVFVDGFKLGANRVLAIGGRERRCGVDLDAVGVDLRDPHGLADALRARRVLSSTSLADVLISLVGEATGPTLDERRREVDEARRRRRLLRMFAGVATAALFSGQTTMALSGDQDAALIVRMAAAALAGAVVVGAVGSSILGVVARRYESHSARAGSALTFVSVVAAVAAVVWVRLQADQWVGAPFVFGHALIGATAGGWVLAVVFPDAADPGSEEGPIVADHRVRVPARVLVAAVASVSVAIIAEREPGGTSDLAVARAAIVAADDLPSGWESCCVARTYRGSGLDMHLCGSAGLPAHTAGFDRQFVLNKTDEGVEGDIVQAVFLAPTVEAARREFAATDAPGYAAFAQASVERRVRSVISDATGEPQTSSARSPLPAGASGIVDRFTTSLPVPEGHDVVFTAFVRMQTGRTIVRMPILTYAAPLTDEELARIVGPAARTLERALRDAPS